MGEWWNIFLNRDTQAHSSNRLEGRYRESSSILSISCLHDHPVVTAWRTSTLLYSVDRRQTISCRLDKALLSFPLIWPLTMQNYIEQAMASIVSPQPMHCSTVKGSLQVYGIHLGFYWAKTRRGFIYLSCWSVRDVHSMMFQIGLHESEIIGQMYNVWHPLIIKLTLSLGLKVATKQE